MSNFKNVLVSVLITIFIPKLFAQLTPVSEQATEKNYIVNGGFESAASGWKAYKNTAQPLPVTGTGGTPTTTITSSTSSPIAGKASGLITKTAANLQGEGVSYAFTVDSAAKGKVLTISGLYQIVSGIYSGGSSGVDSDVEAYIYDVDAAQVIQPAGFKLDGGVSGLNYSIAATFQTNLTSSNYRLIFQIATTSAQAFQLKLDSIKIGVQNRPQGTPVTDWQPYSLVITGSTTNPTFGNLVTNKANWRRVGDSMEIQYNVYQSTAGTPGSGNYRFSLPVGYSIDSSKTPVVDDPNQSIVGSSEIYTSTIAKASIGTVYAATSTSLSIAILNDTVAYGAVGSAFFSLSEPQLTYNFIVKVPILGWSSNLTMSDSADTRVVKARANFAATSLASSATEGVGETIVEFSSSTYDTHGGLTTTTGSRYTAKVPGYYNVNGSLAEFSATGNFVLIVKLYKNGVGYSNRLIRDDNPVINKSYTFADSVFLNAGDYVDIRVFQSSGSIKNFNNGVFNIERVSGPSQIAASESVNASYALSFGQSVSAGGVIKYDTKIFDTHGTYSTTTGLFTAPISGKYLINIQYNPNNPSTSYLIKNGSSAGYLTSATPPGTPLSSGSKTVILLAGDTLAISTDTSGITVSGSGPQGFANSLSITRVGN